MTKPVVCLSYVCFGVAMGRYFVDAFERRDDIDFFTVGPYFDTFIPWQRDNIRGITLPQRYIKSPNFPLPRNFMGMPVTFEMVQNQLPKNIDLFIQADAGFHFVTKPKAKVVALIETDPHVLQAHYAPAEAYSDITFCMQDCYRKAGQIYLPYAVDDHWFYPEKREMVHDACLIGLHYPQRDRLVNLLRKARKDVYYDIGVVYDEYRHKYNESRVALSWSSLKDLPVRNWEAIGMKRCLIANHVPDMNNFFVDGEDYLGFDNELEALDKAMYALNNPDIAEKIALSGYKKIIEGNHTFDSRVQFILESCGLA